MTIDQGIKKLDRNCAFKFTKLLSNIFQIQWNFNTNCLILMGEKNLLEVFFVLFFVPGLGYVTR